MSLERNSESSTAIGYFGGIIMASVAQVQANRFNAQKSTGPRTPEGKAKVAQNAVTHGLLARAAVLQGEDWEEYTCYHEKMLEELHPDGLQETEVAERIVSLSWRLRRAGRYQNAVFEALYDRHAAEPAAGSACPEPGASIAGDPVLGRMLLADFSGDRVLERVLLYERRIESSLCRARADLRQLRRQAPTAAPGGATPFDQMWEESGGYSHASPAARADLARETSEPTQARESPGCETKPICAGSELVPWEESVCQAPPRADKVGRGRPTYEETPRGVTTNARAVPSCETKPISRSKERAKGSPAVPEG
jgi:hypothetical protein